MERHITVFRDEAVDALRIRPDSVIIDATVGSGGHTQHIVSRLGEHGCFVGVDADASAIYGIGALQSKAKTFLRVSNFRNIDTVLDSLGIREADGILADLGWRMEQFSGNGKGFSFSVDEPLIMTYGDPVDYLFTARDIVNEWEEESIKNVLRGYGEERYAGRIARTIVEARKKKAINSTFELVSLIEHAVPVGYRKGRIHPATKTFQALRIAANDELEALREFIGKSFVRLAPAGRIAIITFHSIEDRIVKQAFKALTMQEDATIITKKPMTPTREEQKVNRRARSAKLRIIERT